MHNQYQNPLLHTCFVTTTWEIIATAARSWTLPIDRLVFHCLLASSHTVTTQTQRKNDSHLCTAHRDNAEAIRNALRLHAQPPYLESAIAKSFHREDHGPFEIRDLLR